MMRLISERIYLRAIEPEDYLITINWRNDPETVFNLGGNVYMVSQSREKQWTEMVSTDTSKNIYFAICKTDDDKMIGYSSINNIDLRNQKAEWGGTIIGDKEMWGKGVAKESATLMMKFMFEQYPLHKCYAFCLQDHKVTEKMFNSLGFRLEGIRRDDIFKNGEFKNVLSFSILREEFFDMLRLRCGK